MATTTTQIPPLSVEEEDQIALNRITNDERPLRRIIKKFHSYISSQHNPDPLVPPVDDTLLTDTQKSLLTELDSFQIVLRKNQLICEAEARQVREYEQDRLRIDDEYGTLRGQIEQLKTSLEHAQMERRRKMEYDAVTEKVNTFPTRLELDRAIQSLEHDMSLIRAEHEVQDRTMRSQKAALDTIVSEIAELRFIGKDQDEVLSNPASPRSAILFDGDGLVPEEGEEAQVPEDDIEMGEVEETTAPTFGRGKKKSKDEELEEGEATDSSSALSDPPDD